jgi:hypothetical protein
MNNAEEHANPTAANGHTAVTPAMHSPTLQSLVALAAFHADENGYRRNVSFLSPRNPGVRWRRTSRRR